MRRVNQIKTLLKFRLKQCYRYLNEIGFGIIAVALFVLTGLIFQALQFVLETPAIWSIAMVSLILLVNEIKRDDAIFLKSVFASGNQFRFYKMVENLIIAAPIIIFQCIFLQWQVIQLIVLICALLALIPFYKIRISENERKLDLKFIPLSLFEIKFYFEQHFLLIGFVIVLLLLGPLHISFWILGVLFLCMTPVEIYTPNESREMINYQINFVSNKIVRSMLFFLILISIPWIVVLMFNPSSIYILLYSVLALLLSVILAVSKKYASYYGVQKLGSSSTAVMILTALMLIPGGIIITFGACIYFYLQAEKHMKKLYAIH